MRRTKSWGFSCLLELDKASSRAKTTPSHTQAQLQRIKLRDCLHLWGVVAMTNYTIQTSDSQPVCTFETLEEAHDFLQFYRSYYAKKRQPVPHDYQIMKHTTTTTSEVVK